MSESAALLVDKVLPEVPIRQWVLSVPFALRYLFARDPQAMSAALAIAYRTISAFQRHRAGCRRGQADCGAVTVIQRFGSALNLNVHFHMLMPDGVYAGAAERPRFQRVPAPSGVELRALVERIALRVGRNLERRGILTRQDEVSHLELGSKAGEEGLAELQGLSRREEGQGAERVAHAHDTQHERCAEPL